jgi:hypothetical protein
MSDSQPELSFRRATEIQRAFDAVYWSAPATRVRKQHHILLHLIGAVGKLARWEERQEHGERPNDSILQEAIADLVMYSIQLADLWGYDLSTLYRKRLSSLAYDRNPDDPWQDNTLLREELGGAVRTGRGHET